ncbi:unnamed protein product [Meloidogyne enterolobii]|uniref:Uncharacterized protein n=1 Tax=Meloidogyne enterolobii TaxID=390850 RepID=A0ACB0ZNJ2_MELEN
MPVFQIFKIRQTPERQNLPKIAPKHYVKFFSLRISSKIISGGLILDWEFFKIQKGNAIFHVFLDLPQKSWFFS